MQIRSSLSLSSISAFLVLLLVFVGRYDINGWQLDSKSSPSALFMLQLHQFRWWIIATLAAITFFDRLLQKRRYFLSVRSNWALFTLIGLMLTLLGSVAFTSGDIWTLAKIVDVVNLSLLLLIVHYWANRNSIGQIQWIDWLIWYGFLVGGVAAVFAFATLDLTVRTSIVGGGPNTFVRIVGVTGLCCLGLRRVPYLVQLMVLILLTGLILTTQSRGGALAFVVSSCLLIVWARGRTRRIILGLGFAIAAVSIAPMTTFGQHSIGILQERFYKQTYQQAYTAGRTVIYEDSWDIWCERPILGHGLNEWWTRIGGYPHNIFLELGCDAGMLAVFWMVSFCLLFAYRAVRCRTDSHRTVVCIALFYLIAAQFSGDIFDSRGFFCFGLIACGSTRRTTRRNINGSHRSVDMPSTFGHL